MTRMERRWRPWLLACRGGGPAPVAFPEEGVGPAGRGGGLAEHSLKVRVALAGPAGAFLAPDWTVCGLSLAQDTRWPGVGKALMCRPISAMIAWAASRPMPVTSSRRSTAGSTGVPWPRPAPGRCCRRHRCPGRRESRRSVPRSGWGACRSGPTGRRSGPAASGPARRDGHRTAGQRLDQAVVLGPHPAPARLASTCGSRSPAISASSMSRTDLVSSLLAMAETLIRASSSSFSSRECAGCARGPGRCAAGCNPAAGGSEPGRTMAGACRLGELRQRHRIQLVRLRPAGGLLHVPGPHQLHVRRPLRAGKPDPPVVRGHSR